MDKFLILAILFVLTILYFRNKNPSTHLPYPPGPKKLPLLKNILDLPTSFPCKTYAQWGKEYSSDIIHLSAAGIDIVVLNSFKAATDLFEKKSSIYSSRPQFTMISELMGWKWLMSAMVYGQPWKERRRLFQKYFHPSTAAFYEPQQKQCIRKVLARLLESPSDFLQITRHAMGSLTLSLAFGIKTLDVDDPYINIAEKAVASISEASVNAFLVDVIPILKYVPEWVPGAGFKRKAREWYQIQADFHNKPLQATLDEMAAGIATPSFASIALENLSAGANVEHEMEVIKDTAGIVFAGGADTTLSGVHTFFAAMLCYPDIQRKAQAELDRVLQGRLPELDDKEDLPYLTALVKEVLRWRPATPIAVPHSVSEDDVYDGYHIPKDSLVIGNVWAMLHDEEDYPDPSTFKPERFLKDGKLDPTVRDPALIAFGFGRRICPGSHIALSTTWLVAANVLAAFNISKAIGEDGLPVEPSVKYLSGMITHPEPFKCTIKPRSKAAEQLVRSVADDCY